MAYAIKDGYVERPEPSYFLDDPKGATFQVDVYWYTFGVGVELGARGIVDVGCGYADKLAQVQAHRLDWRYVGVDHGENLRWCRDTYPWGEWLEVDLEQPHEIDAEGCVIVSADVIEHLRDPSHYLEAIRSSGCLAAILSTPERDLQWGAEHNGPPPNPCHVREWNRGELAGFLEDAGFEVEHIGTTRSNDLGSDEFTTLVRVTP